MLTLQSILQVEDTQEILHFACPGTDYLLWPYLRRLVLSMVMDREIFAGTFLNLDSAGSAGRLPVLRCLVDGVLHNLRFLNRQARIVFFNSGMGNIMVSGKFLNRVTDHFAFCYPDTTLLMESPHKLCHLRPRVNQSVAYSWPFEMFLAIASRTCSKKLDEKPIAEFIRFLDSRLMSILGFKLNEKQLKHLFTVLVRHCAGLCINLRMYKALYRKLKPSIIFFEDGCYGTHGHLIKLAKQMGIKTGELQHGMISTGHYAYNFAPEILNSGVYGQYVPDFFLAYGKRWADSIHIPSEIIVVGNPYREAMHKKYQRERKKTISFLILSDDTEFGKYLNLAVSLKELSNAATIMIRPHPLEKEEVIKKFGVNNQGIRIDDSDDLYLRLAESETVIGEISTALFESIGLAERIFAKRNYINSFYMPDCPFELFETVEELLSKLRDDTCGKISIDAATSMWASDWELNYRSFITQRVGLNTNAGDRAVESLSCRSGGCGRPD